METVDWDERYKGEAADRPWDSGMPDPNLMEFLEKHRGLVKRALDIGCGTGTNAIWLAQQGISVIGTDISPTAIKIALSKAINAKSKPAFLVEDICADNRTPPTPVDFVFDRGVFHVMPEDKRPLFVQRVADSLVDHGWWLCLAGSADETKPTENGPPRMTATEVVSEIEKLFELHTMVRDLFNLPNGNSYLAWKSIWRKRRG